MELIDSHAHLDLLDEPQAALAAARQAGVSQIVTIGIDLASSQAAAAWAQAEANVFFTVGLHPHDAAQASDQLWDSLRDLAGQGAVGVGECGLDYFRDRSPRGMQQAAFAAQIALARELKLPLVIHNRDAEQDTLPILRENGAAEVGGVVHCFSGGPEFAKGVLDLGFYLGIPGTITYKNNQALRDLVKTAPADRLVVETDCPFLAPVPKRGKPNQPAFAAYTNQTLADCLGLAAEECAALTTANSRRLFGLPKPGE